MKFKVALLLGVLFPLSCHKDNAATAGSTSAAAAASGAPAAAPPPGASLALLDGFEGEVALTAKGKFGSKVASQTPVSFVLQVKDGKVRVDVPEGVSDLKDTGKIFLLVSPAEKKAFAVLEGKKQAVLIDFDKLAAQGKAMAGAHPGSHPPGSPGAAPDLKKTGKIEAVAGYNCEVWQLTRAASVTDLCIAEQSTPFLHIPLEGMPAEYAWASELADGKHFPLRLVAIEGGAEQGRIEVTGISKKTLPAALFVVPAEYPVLDLQQMLAAMMGMGMGMGGLGMPPGMAPGFLPPGLPPGLAASARAAQAAAIAAHKKH